MSTPIRERAGWNNLGLRRYQRYVSAFDHVQRCITKGFFLEAIAVVDSLLSDRLTSRLAHLAGANQLKATPTGTLCTELVGQNGTSGRETDDELRSVIVDIQSWARSRNDALHAAAKIFSDSDADTTFAALLESHRTSAQRGVDCLQRFDRVDTALRRGIGKTPATYPGAFDPALRPARKERDGSSSTHTRPAQQRAAADGRKRSHPRKLG